MAQEATELICMITKGTDHELSSVGLRLRMAELQPD
jgi:hypothetical protein